jgi:hypothetical protein
MHIKCETPDAERHASAVLAQHGLHEGNGFFTTEPQEGDTCIVLTINRALSADTLTLIRKDLQQASDIAIEESGA